MEKILFGGDYNPEQWPKEIWEEDQQLFEEAKIDTVSIGIFAWALIQKDEETYDFSKMDEMMEYLYHTNKKIILATGTAAHPAWMANRYPDVTRVDFEGRKRKFGQRHNSSPNSPTYKKYSALMARKMAERYKDYDNIIAWHINNEYGGACYSDESAIAFRRWLKEKYQSLEKLNEAWNTTFWSHTFYDWDEIVPPNNLSEHLGSENVTAFQGITLDYMRFNSDSMLDNFIQEKKEIKRYTPNIPVTTNFMGMYRPLDYFKWAPHLDFISWDNYPPDLQSQARMALTHDLMRGLKKGKPFWLMEQTPSTTACRGFNPIKRPGLNRLWSYQALAHGSDSVLYFQMRKSKGACEKYHGAILNQSARNDTRVFRECKQIGEELVTLGDAFVQAETKSKVAFVFDWDSWWSVEISDGPSRHVGYQKTMIKYYKAMYELNVDIDVIGVDDDLTGYEVVIAPLLHMIKDNYDEKIKAFVDQGGTFITTYLSGIVDEHDNSVLTDYPGPLKELLGIWVEETDSLDPKDFNQIHLKNQAEGYQSSYTCNLIFDIIHAESAEVFAEYGSDFYKNTPVVTRNTYGKGNAWYLASEPEFQFLKDLFNDVCANHSIQSALNAPSDVEVVSRHKEGFTYTFVLNHNASTTQVELPFTCEDLLKNRQYSEKTSLTIDAHDAVILRYRGDL